MKVSRNQEEFEEKTKALEQSNESGKEEGKDMKDLENGPQDKVMEPLIKEVKENELVVSQELRASDQVGSQMQTQPNLAKNDPISGTKK